MTRGATPELSEDAVASITDAGQLLQWQRVPAQLRDGVRPEEARACETLASQWETNAAAAAQRRSAAPRVNLTYFLHVPRTAGRTTFWCALKPAFPPSQRCSRSYDHLRLDPHQPTCNLLSTHDDFSLVESFPGAATVATQLRRPLDRVLSAYEFAVEVAGRHAFGGQRQRRRHVLDGQASNNIDTRDVWPWSTMVNLMIADMNARREARGGAPPQRAQPQGGSGYDEPAAYMPLAEFVNHPDVAEVLHNGAAFQLMGLTNNTHEAEHAAAASRLRACVSASAIAAGHLSDGALRRLHDEVAVVTLTEQLDDSASMLAAALGRPLSAPSFRTAADWDPVAKREHMAQGREAFDAAALDPSNPLGVVYRSCAEKQYNVFSTRKRNDRARVAFSDGQGVLFDRSKLPQELLDRIERLNSLDVALYDAGEALFKKRRAAYQEQGVWETVSDVVASRSAA